ncbi:2-C-methyl-D-erythritol 4-phosphate cytidylyltransferase [Brachybacterium sp.]|uniref:2-C-methyl-D-erythritol 4-phosphate cytidylyltransferase n=1 Tax=Brachybacterium sp. TaxID=1891286 RepID=UPI002ED20494
MLSAPIRSAAVRPVVLALAPRAAGLSPGLSTPSLERLGGSRLVDRLLSTLQGAGLPTPLVVTSRASAPQLREALGPEVPVDAVAGDRRAALRAALDRTEEELLLVHDAERALTPVDVVLGVLSGLHDEVEAVVPVVAMTDSVKEVRPEGLRNIDRATLTGLQSPRLLRRELLESVLADERPTTARAAAVGGDFGGFDEIRTALEIGARVGTVHGSHAGFAVLDRLSLWQAQISLGLARDTSHRHGLARRS